jgi:hypothetical protein
MKKKLIEITDEETYAIENGDEINEGIYSLAYEEQYLDDLHDELYGILEHIGYLQYLCDRYAKAEENLMAMENQIKMSIGEDSYEDMIDLIFWQQRRLESDIKELFEKHDDLNQSNSKAVNNNIKNKVK